MQLKMIYFRYTLCVLYAGLTRSASAQGTSGQIGNLAEGQPVIVSPDSGTCGKDSSSSTFLFPELFFNPELYQGNDFPNYEGLEFPPGSEIDIPLFNTEYVERKCGSSTKDCPRVDPKNAKFTSVIKDVTPVGGKNCVPHYQRENTDLRRKRQTQVLCYISSNLIHSPGETYTMWVRPKPGSSGTIFDAGLFRLDLHQGDLFFILSNDQSQRITESVPVIPENQWTHIAVQVDNINSAYGHSYYVFVDGKYRTNIYQNLINVGRSVVDGPYQVRIGASLQIDNQTTGCELLQIPECRISGFEGGVNINAVKQGAYYDGLYKNHQSLKAACPDNIAAVTFLLCANSLPTCERNPICRSLCESIMSLQNNCSEEVAKFLICDKLPDDKTTPNCVNLNTKPKYGLYHGEVKYVRKYDSILTNREIYKSVHGELPSVMPLSDCLCPEIAPAISFRRNDICSFRDTFPYYSRVNFNMTHGKAFHLPQYVVDGVVDIYGINSNQPLFWVSAPGLKEVSLTIELQELSEIGIVEINILSTPPEGSMRLDRRIGKEWKTWHYFSVDCKAIGYQLVGAASTQDGIACQDISESNDGRQRARMIRWEIGHLRPGSNGNVFPDWQDEALALFKQAEAVRLTFVGPPIGNWTSDKQKVHAVSEIQFIGRELGNKIWPDDGELACDCFLPGTAGPSTDSPLQAPSSFPTGPPAGSSTDNQPCDDQGQCKCLPGTNIALAGKQCLPYINYTFPVYGPEAGGTRILILGGLLGDSAVVQLESSKDGRVLDTKRVTSNDTMIVVDTQPVDLNQDPHWSGPLIIKIFLKSGILLIADKPFQYKPDPIIAEIRPRKAILQGGIAQTVMGMHLDSVAVPKMFLTEVYRDRTFEYPPEICTVINSTTMTCPTPQINLPPELSLQTTRRKRSVQENTILKALYGSNLSPDLTEPQDEGLHTVIKRETSGTTSITDSNPDYALYVGFDLDGVVTYNNLSAVLPQYAELSLYVDPVFVTFKEDLGKEIVDYMDNLVIKGQWMDAGAQMSDYQILVGSEQCAMVELLSNQLICIPPTEKPPKTDVNFRVSSNGDPRVLAKVGNIEAVIGFMKYDDGLSPLIIGIIAAAILLLIIIIVIFLLMRHRRNTNLSHLKDQVHNRSDDQGNEYLGLSHKKTLLERLNPGLRGRLGDCLLSPASLQRGQEIGKGNFGMVFAGMLQDGHLQTKVAVKTVKDQDGSIKETEEFLAEATIMKDFKHDHVLSLIGVVIEDDKVYVVLPYMENGSLRDYLITTQQSFTVYQLLQMADQCAKGMAYLESQKFIHRDLAARNCMVDAQINVKIADFGLARDIYEKEYYRQEDKSRPLPVKWTALECLQGKEFTTKSDVWSYGVLLWEIITRGKRPYNDVNNYDLKSYLHIGRRLEKPERCPDPIYDLMMACWQIIPADRPTFQEIEDYLKTVLDPNATAIPAQSAGEYLRISRLGSQDNGEYLRMSTVGLQDKRESIECSYLQTFSQNPDDYLVVIDA